MGQNTEQQETYSIEITAAISLPAYSKVSG